MGYKIAIDGPSGTGKGYVARVVSGILGIVNIDTGAMYRAFALYCSENNVNIHEENEIKEALANVNINFEHTNNGLKIMLNGKDVSQSIRTEQVGFLASKVSSIVQVREYMVEKQRNLAGENNVLMEGRDIGSVVFPDAELKIYLTAEPKTRAERRYNELVLKGENVTFDQVLEDIQRRDEADKTKAISPLIKTEDMIEIDSTNLSKEQVVKRVLELLKDKGLV